MSSGHRSSGSYGSHGSHGSGQRPRRPSTPGSHAARAIASNRPNPNPNTPYPYPVSSGNPLATTNQCPQARGGFGNAPQDRGRPQTYDTSPGTQTVRRRSGTASQFLGCWGFIRGRVQDPGLLREVARGFLVVCRDRILKREIRIDREDLSREMVVVLGTLVLEAKAKAVDVIRFESWL